MGISYSDCDVLMKISGWWLSIGSSGAPLVGGLSVHGMRECETQESVLGLLRSNGNAHFFPYIYQNKANCR